MKTKESKSLFIQFSLWFKHGIAVGAFTTCKKPCHKCYDSSRSVKFINLNLLIKTVFVIWWQSRMISGHFPKGAVEELFSGQTLHLCTWLKILDVIQFLSFSSRLSVKPVLGEMDQLHHLLRSVPALECSIILNILGLCMHSWICFRMNLSLVMLQCMPKSWNLLSFLCQGQHTNLLKKSQSKN